MYLQKADYLIGLLQQDPYIPSNDEVNVILRVLLLMFLYQKFVRQSSILIEGFCDLFQEVSRKV